MSWIHWLESETSNEGLFPVAERFTTRCEDFIAITGSNKFRLFCATRFEYFKARKGKQKPSFCKDYFEYLIRKNISRISRLFPKSTKLNSREKNIFVNRKIKFPWTFLHVIANFIVYKSISVGVAWFWNIHTMQSTRYMNLIFYFQVMLKECWRKYGKAKLY